ncbi:hypothetical protein [Sinomicrobium sp. M5D2P9]
MAKTGPGSSGREYDMPVRRQRQVYLFRAAVHPEFASRLAVIPSAERCYYCRHLVSRDAFGYSPGVLPNADSEVSDIRAHFPAG